MLVLIEDHLSDASLNDELGALIAWEHGDIDGSSRKGRCILGIEDRVGLSMHHIGVLCLQFAAIGGNFGPRQTSIMAAPGEAVVADAKNDLIPADNACSNLQVMTKLLMILCLIL